MASTYLSRTTGSPTLATKYTISFWVKRSKPGADMRMFNNYVDGNASGQLYFNATDQLNLYDVSGGSSAMALVTNRKFRDPNAFMHIVIAVDTTQSTSSDRAKIYINGTQETSLATSTYPSQNHSLSMQAVSASGQRRIGSHNGGGDYFDGCLAHLHYVDGSALAPTVFAETDSTSGIWKPKTAPSVTYGTNGEFLKFENSGAMGTDSSGNSNTYSVSGTMTQNTDTPTNNFCTLNALDYNSISLSNGNLEGAWSQSAGTFGFTRGTIGFGSGKYYWEVKISSSDNSAGLGLGVVDLGKKQLSSTTNQGNSIASFFGVGASFSTTKALYKQSNNTSTSITGSWANDDIIGIAYDGSTGKIYMWKNDSEFSGQTFASGTSFNDVNLTADTFVVPYIGVGDGGSGTKNVNVKFNFGSGFFGTTAVASANADANGHGAFEYAVPSGHYAINTKNLKEFG
tara:strand:+ start:37 stop:1404 length:1368 start_codon:yes stop_codon:yes gene_type:complete